LERFRSLDVQTESTKINISPPTFTRPLKSSLEKMHHSLDDNNDSSTSTTTRSIHIPIEKQRGLSEIIRKRNSRFKVEDYKRSIHKSNTFDSDEIEQLRTIPISRSDYSLSNIQKLNKTKSMDANIDYRNNKHNSFNEYVALGHRSFSFELNIQSIRMSFFDTFRNEEIDEAMSVAAKKSLFETFTKDAPIKRGLTRSKSFKHERYKKSNE